MACGCEHSVLDTCPQCEFEAFVRNHFFTGKLMGAGDFIAESRFHQEKMRHHNVRLHGWGVVCGLKVHQHPSPDCRDRYVVVDSGTGVDCCGHEILVPQQEIVDVARHPKVVAKTNDGLLHTLQVAVCFRECPTEDVPILYDECGCDDTQCAPNRILESFAFDVLVDPPLGAGVGGAAAAGAFVATDAHGATGFVQAGAAGKVAVVDPADATRVFVLDPAHRLLSTVTLAKPARAIAMGRDGAQFFVVTDPAAGPALEVHVFNTADGTEVPTIAAGAVRAIPGTTAATNIAIAAVSNTAAPARSLVAFDRTAGKVFQWQTDAGHVIKDNPDPAIAFVAGSAFIATPDGSAAFTVDAAGKVQVLDIATSAVTALGGLPASAKPNALAPFSMAGTNMLAVASGVEKRMYVTDRGAGTLKATVDLAHAPTFLGLTGAAAAPWLVAYEEDAGQAYVQAIALGSLAGGNPPLVAGPRAAGSGPKRIVLVYDDGQADVIDPALFADSDCADLLRQQTCGGCALPECLVLATIANYLSGMQLLDMPADANDIPKKQARLDNRRGRRLLASTATLQAWLECLQLKGGVPGPKGDPGKDGEDGKDGKDGANGAPGADGTVINGVEIDLGNCATKPQGGIDANGILRLLLPKCCDDDLTHICGINWQHAGQVDPAKVDRVVLAFDRPIYGPDFAQRFIRNVFIVETNSTNLIDPRTGLRVECWCQLEGEYRAGKLRQTCDAASGFVAGPPDAVEFVPSPRLQPNRTYRVRFLGDLARDDRAGKPGRAIDANHLPPWVGVRKTGDCIEGGTFESYFTTMQQG